MKKKNLYIIIGIIVILILGFILAAFIIMQKGGGAGGPGSNNPFINLFPFGQPVTPSGTGTTGGTGGEGGTAGGGAGGTTVNLSNPLRQISLTPTAGALPVIKNSKVYADYVERATGNVFEMSLADMQQTRLSNVLIPRIHEALLGNGGKTAILRYVETDGLDDIIDSFALDVTNPAKPNNTVITDASSTPSSEPNGIFLTKNIASAFPSSDANSMFFLSSTGPFSQRKTTGTIYNIQKGTLTDVFQSQFSDWLPVMFNGNTIMLQTKASQMVPGYLYSLNTKTGAFARILGDKNGFTALPSPDGQKILYSSSVPGGVKTYLFNRADNSTLNISSATLPEKCVWKQDNSAVYCAVPETISYGVYPDAWYQGSISFVDNIWKIDAASGGVTSIVVPQSRANQPMDITNMQLSPDGKYLIFINKRDSTLWMFDLTGTE